MEALQKVVEVLEKPGTLPQRLAESEVQDGLRQLERILVAAVDGESPGVQGWTKQQQEFVLAVVEAILCASSHLVADGGDKEVVEQIYGLAVQLCIQGLESCLSKPGTSAVLLDEEVGKFLTNCVDLMLLVKLKFGFKCPELSSTASTRIDKLLSSGQAIFLPDVRSIWPPLRSSMERIKSHVSFSFVYKCLCFVKLDPFKKTILWLKVHNHLPST